MKQGVFQESVEILQEYPVRNSYVIPTIVHKKQRVKLRLPEKQQTQTVTTVRFRQQPVESEEEDPECQTILDYCKNNQGCLVYRKYDNRNFNTIYAMEYAASLFMNIEKNKPYSRLKITQKLTSLQQLLQSTLKIDIKPQQKQRIITFDSNFQSGNLLQAYKVAHNQYDLILHNDINSKGNIQWFYFSVSVEYPIQIQFNIINMLKYDSLFNYGMQVAVFSEKRNRKSNQGWIRAGKNISYEKNDLKIEYKNKHYYTLSFKYDFKFEDKVYFAHSYPYTYNMLNELIFNISSNPIKGKVCKRSIIGMTHMNIPIDCLTFSNEQKEKKKAIVILARQHAGETVGSWVIEGVIEHLSKKCKESEFLKKNYVVQIIPMVNPDGVVIGNYRSNLSGSDLNRNWHTDKKTLFPQIIAIRNYIQDLAKERKIKIIIDIHGHSKKMQTFFYGNTGLSPQSVRLFPYIASKVSTQVNFDQCTFTNSQSRRNTARIYLSSMLNMPYVYTYECSFYGGIKGKYKYSYTCEHYKKIGAELVQSLYEYSNQESQLFKKCLKQLCSNMNLIKGGGQSSCSESCPDDAELKDQEREAITIQVPEIMRKSSFKSPAKREKSARKCYKTNKIEAKIMEYPGSTQQSLLQRRQMQKIMEFRRNLEAFELIMLTTRLNKRIQTADQEVQVDIPEIIQQGSHHRRQILKSPGCKLIFVIQPKRYKSTQVIRHEPQKKFLHLRQESHKKTTVDRGCQVGGFRQSTSRTLTSRMASSAEFRTRTSSIRHRKIQQFRIQDQQF